MQQHFPMQFLHFNLETFIRAAGYLGVFGIVFAESGLLIGFFLPGDSLLFTAGILASQGYLNIWILAIGALIFAVIGDNVGYSIGKKMGPKILKEKHVQRAQEFYEKHGKKTIILARFVPVVRTFAPVVAGVGNMNYRTFFAYNVIGGVIWGALVPILGFFLGSHIPNIDHYLLPIIAGIIVVSILPGIFHLLRKKH